MSSNFESEDKLLQSAKQDLASLQSDIEHPRIIDGRLSELEVNYNRLIAEAERVKASHEVLTKYRDSLPEKVEAAKKRIEDLRKSSFERIEAAKRSKLSSEMEAILAKIAGTNISTDDLIACLQQKKVEESSL